MEIVTLRIRRVGHAPPLRLPVVRATERNVAPPSADLVTAAGSKATVPVLSRAGLIGDRAVPGSLLLIDAEATAFIPPNWAARANEDGGVVVEAT